MKINQHKGSAIIISANGMCTAGRIKHHLKHNLWRPGAAIVIVGFQGQGTTGRQIVEGAKSVTIFGEKIAVRAKVFTIGGISAHADQADLLRWVGHFAKVSRPKVFVIHGEMPVSQTFAQLVQEKTGLKAYVPQRQEVLSLPKDLSAVERRVADKENLITRASEIEADMQKLKNLISTGDKIPTPEEIEALQQIVSQLKAIVEK
jgi:metallo-beta-lactamase family protein